jgi:dTDP-glucose 4,6-dehydratase
VRIFNTYGPRMALDDGRVIPNFIGQTLRGEPLTIYGDGSQTRSFCFYTDLIEGIYRLLNSDFVQPVNLGNPYTEMSMVQLAELVNRLSGSRGGIVYKKDLRIKGDPQLRQPDVTRAREILGWEPKVKFADGLQETIDYFKKRL